MEEGEGGRYGKERKWRKGRKGRRERLAPPLLRKFFLYISKPLNKRYPHCTYNTTEFHLTRKSNKQPRFC